MKRTKLFLLVLCVLAAACGGDSAMNANAPVKNTPVRTPTETKTPQPTSVNKPVADSQVTPPQSSSNTMTNTGAIKKNGKTPAATAAPTPVATPAPSTSEKKDEGLFSFPPPGTHISTEIKIAGLRTDAQTTLADVSEKLAGALEKGGYSRGKYSYFWNDNEEFAVVTAMERINPDGENLPGTERWVTNKKLPKARTISEYFDYLIGGKRAFYRVFAFVVTPRRRLSQFDNYPPPEFMMALNWKTRGESELGGDGEPTSVENVLFNEKYKCFTLVYLFVNHTSLDEPKSIDAPDAERWGEALERDAVKHLEKTNIRFGD